MSNTTTCIIVLICSVIGGCASVSVTPVSADDTMTKGIRVFQPQPYLLVTWGAEQTSAAGGAAGKPDKAVVLKADAPATQQAPTTQAVNVYTVKIVYLPDYSRPSAVSINSGFGTIDGSMKIVDGWQLTDLNAKADTKIPETITAVTGLLEQIGTIGGVP